jgi:hypothetical protein
MVSSRLMAVASVVICEGGRRAVQTSWLVPGRVCVVTRLLGLVFGPRHIMVSMHPSSLSRCLHHGSNGGDVVGYVPHK